MVLAVAEVGADGVKVVGGAVVVEEEAVEGVGNGLSRSAVIEGTKAGVGVRRSVGRDGGEPPVGDGAAAGRAALIMLTATSEEQERELNASLANLRVPQQSGGHKRHQDEQRLTMEPWRMTK